MNSYLRYLRQLNKMQQTNHFDQHKHLKHLYGQSVIQKLKQTTILMIGVGGLGCQMIKSLCKLPIKKLTIIDLDIIQLSNLNRQFYFHKEHISLSKSKVAKQQILKINPYFPIQAIEGDIFDKKYDNYYFYSQFNLVLSGLDSLKVRQYVAKNTIKYDIPLIDAGTSGYFGQSYFSVRFLTSCHNCSPSHNQQSFAVCTIRSRPQKTIHCAVYAKKFYDSFFGSNNDHEQISLNAKIISFKQNIIQISENIYNYQTLTAQIIRLFDYLFYYQIQSVDEQGISFFAKKFKFDQVKIQKSTKQQHSQQQIWSISQYAHIFVKSFHNLLKRKRQHQNIPHSFDKEDKDCVLLVACITNLRVYNFMNYNRDKQIDTGKGELKLISVSQCRKLLGKLIPSISSTNSMASSLEILQIFCLLKSPILPSKYLTISPYRQQKISSSWISLPNQNCQYCSPKNLYFIVQTQFDKRTFGEFQQFAEMHCYQQGRDLYCGNVLVVKNVKVDKISPNKHKLLNFKPAFISNGILLLNFYPLTNQTDLKVQITLIDTQQCQSNQQDSKFKIKNSQQIEKTINLYKLKQKQNSQKVHEHIL